MLTGPDGRPLSLPPNTITGEQLVAICGQLRRVAVTAVLVPLDVEADYIVALSQTTFGPAAQARIQIYHQRLCHAASGAPRDALRRNFFCIAQNDAPTAPVVGRIRNTSERRWSPSLARPPRH